MVATRGMANDRRLDDRDPDCSRTTTFFMAASFGVSCSQSFMALHSADVLRVDPLAVAVGFIDGLERTEGLSRNRLARPPPLACSNADYAGADLCGNTLSNFALEGSLSFEFDGDREGVH